MSEFLDHAHTVEADTSPHILRTWGKRIELMGVAGAVCVLDCIAMSPYELQRVHCGDGAIRYLVH